MTTIWSNQKSGIGCSCFEECTRHELCGHRKGYCRSRWKSKEKRIEYGRYGWRYIYYFKRRCIWIIIWYTNHKSTSISYPWNAWNVRETSSKEWAGGNSSYDVHCPNVWPSSNRRKRSSHLFKDHQNCGWRSKSDASRPIITNWYRLKLINKCIKHYTIEVLNGNFVQTPWYERPCVG